MRALLTLMPLLLACDRRLEIDRPLPEKDPTTAWKALLESAARPDGVNYTLIETNREVLQDYLRWIGEKGPNATAVRESNEDKCIAMLVNAYNAWVIEGVLRNQPLASVLDVSFGPYAMRPGMSFFVGQQIRVDKDWTNLYRLEVHSILNRYQEPMLHITLNCASKGCPPLRYWPERGLQTAMSRAWRSWLSSDKALRKEGDGWAANEIFYWYEDDFLDWTDAITLCDWMAGYTGDERGQWMRAHAEDCPLGRFEYDWSLNAVAADAPGIAPLDPIEEGPVDEGPAEVAGDEDEGF